MRRRAARGFTILELMLVSALIAILATMAVPKLLNWKARSERSEAKTVMAVLRTQLETEMGEEGAYTDDLQAISFTPEGSPRYLYGFTSDMSGSGVNDTAELSGIITSYSTSMMVNAASLPLSSADLPPSTVTDSTYIIGAVGNVDQDGTLDQWTLSKSGGFNEVLNDVTN